MTDDLVRQLRQPFGPTAGPTAVNRIQDMNKQRRHAADRISQLEREKAEQKSRSRHAGERAALYMRRRNADRSIRGNPKRRLQIAERRAKQ